MLQNVPHRCWWRLVLFTLCWQARVPRSLRSTQVDGADRRCIAVHGRMKQGSVFSCMIVV